jgi:hypothetical protein
MISLKWCACFENENVIFRKMSKDVCVRSMSELVPVCLGMLGVVHLVD